MTDAQIAMDSEETALLATINAHRQENGRAALTADATLNRAAAWMSAVSARRGVSPSDHIDTLNRDRATRFADCGYTAVGNENVYWGHGVDQNGRDWASRASAFRFWSIESQAHNATMLDPQYRFAGVARECRDGKCHFTLTVGTQAGPAQTPPQQPGGGTTQTPSGGTTQSADWPVLRQGANGEAVQTLQLLLRHHGQSLEVDGDFGPLTAGAVRAFQQARNLTVDGIVGPQTWSALIVTVRNGSQGQAVRALQMQLDARGVDIAVDGDFGPQTEAAVRAYQQRAGLSVDGIVGPQTWRSLIAGR